MRYKRFPAMLSVQGENGRPDLVIVEALGEVEVRAVVAVIIVGTVVPVLETGRDCRQCHITVHSILVSTFSLTHRLTYVRIQSSHPEGPYQDFSCLL